MCASCDTSDAVTCFMCKVNIPSGAPRIVWRTKSGKPKSLCTDCDNTLTSI